MGAPIPKQFLPLGGKPVALHSFDLFASFPGIGEIVVVCEKPHQNYFSTEWKPLSFAAAGLRRQDSVYNGLLACDPSASLILVHDSARPFVEERHVSALIETARRMGAATLGAPVSCTIKQCDPKRQVERTLDRSVLWEIQTPQALQADLIRQGFETVRSRGLEVTDDVAVAEAIGHPVEVVAGSPRNFKLTTPFDWAVAQTLLSHGAA
jgi:2-C-methyl-D-erythritol 4-phosphate cytidylyltransferase